MNVFRASALFRPYRHYLLALVALQGGSSLFFLAGPYLSKLFIDQAFLVKDAHRFVTLSMVGAGFFLASMAIKAVEECVKKRVSAKIKLSLFRRALHKFYSLEVGYFQHSSVGQTLYQMANLEEIHRFLVDDFPQIIIDLIKVLVIFLIAMRINSGLTGIVAMVSPLFLLWSLAMQKKMLPMYAGLWEAQARLTRQMQEAFSRMHIVKALGLERALRNRTLRDLIESLRASLIHARWSLVNTVSSSFLAKALYGALSLYGGWQIIQGRLSVGSLAAVMLYVGQLGGLLESLSSNIQNVSEHSVYLEKFFEVMARIPALAVSPDGLERFCAQKEIAFLRVSFSYEKDRPVLRHVSLRIPCKTMVAIVGPSGCGKTTLVNLLLRLFDPDEGSISIDGVPLSKLPLRAHMAIATQEASLFNLSIKENIVLGARGISDREVRDAIEVAQLQEVILALPQGLDTMVGEAGCMLSEGTKQRVAIARAFIRAPELLILDEATSSLDSVTEDALLRALMRKREGKTSIVISHRLSAVRHAQRVYFMSNGSILHEGTHEQLLHSVAAYYDYFACQISDKKLD